MEMFLLTLEKTENVIEGVKEKLNVATEDVMKKFLRIVEIILEDVGVAAAVVVNTDVIIITIM